MSVHDPDSPSSAAYRRFRQQMDTVPSKSVDAAKIYENHNLDLMTRRVSRYKKKQKAIEDILQAVGDGSGDDYGFGTESMVVQPSRKVLPAPERPWIRSFQFAAPALALCTLVVVLVNVVWPSRVSEHLAYIPDSLTDPAMAQYIAPPSNDAEFGFISSTIPQTRPYSLGVTTVLLVLAARLEDDSGMPMIAAYLDSLSSFPDEAGASIKNLAETTRRGDFDALDSGIENLTQTLDQVPDDALWFDFGQLVQSLRLALLLTEEAADTQALNDVRNLITDFDFSSTVSTQLPKVKTILTELRILASREGEWSRSDRRAALRYTEQINVLLR